MDINQLEIGPKEMESTYSIGQFGSHSECGLGGHSVLTVNQQEHCLDAGTYTEEMVIGTHKWTPRLSHLTPPTSDIITVPSTMPLCEYIQGHQPRSDEVRASLVTPSTHDPPL